jgi:hypothetical protein
MGLELQPVIISSDHEIGCRVKDYYFGLDHHGNSCIYKDKFMFIYIHIYRNKHIYVYVY